MFESTCPNCGNDIDLAVDFMHLADGKEYICDRCEAVLVGYYDEAITDDGEVEFVFLKKAEKK